MKMGRHFGDILVLKLPTAYTNTEDRNPNRCRNVPRLDVTSETAELGELLRASLSAFANCRRYGCVERPFPTATCLPLRQKPLMQ